MNENDEYSEENYDGEETENSGSFISAILTKSNAKIIFTVAAVLFFIIGSFGKTVTQNTGTQPQENAVTAVSGNTVPQEDVSAQGDIPPQGTENQKSKTTMDYIRSLKIGKSNLIALGILGGSLIYLQLWRKQDEEQKSTTIRRK